MIDLYLSGKSILLLPPTKKPRRNAVILRPGENRLEPAYWEAVKDHPGVACHIGGLLRTDKVAMEQRESTVSPDRNTGLARMTIEQASPWIESCSDADRLVAWRNADRRKGIHELIDIRLSELADL